MQSSFVKRKKKIENFEKRRKEEAKVVKKEKKVALPDVRAFMNCPSCQETVLIDEVKKNFYICPKCNEHLTCPSDVRLEMLFDKGRYKELRPKQVIENPIDFPGYDEKKVAIQSSLQVEEAAIAGVGKIDKQTCVCICMDSRFLMASMGVYVGELVSSAIEYAKAKKLPLIIFSASGGARMQEGIFSLMQMAKTTAILEKFLSSGGLYISYLTHPTTGGVSASFASLGDIILAEPGALIGFAGPRVIKETIKQELPEGFQSSEYLMEHGFVDEIVHRCEMKATLSLLLKLHAKEKVNVSRIRG